MATLHNPRESEETCITCGEVIGAKGEMPWFLLMRHYFHTVGIMWGSLNFLRYGLYYMHNRRFPILYILSVIPLMIWLFRA